MSSGSKPSFFDSVARDSVDIKPDTADGCADPSTARGGPVALRESTECRREPVSLRDSFQLFDDRVPFLDQVGAVYEHVQDSAGETGHIQLYDLNLFFRVEIGIYLIDSSGMIPILQSDRILTS
jgi:hypothetical protein